MTRFWRWLRKGEEAATAVEYAVLLALILMVIISAITAVGSGTGGMWGNVDTDMQAAGLGN